MTIDEAIVFKNYDNGLDTKTRAVFHAAFEHPGTPEDSPGRHSLEMRLVAIFDN
jgi:hypothetical protein